MLLKTWINCSPEYPITIDRVTALIWMEIKHWLSTLGFLPKVTTLYLSFNNKPLRWRYQQCIHGMLPFQELLVSHLEGSWEVGNICLFSGWNIEFCFYCYRTFFWIWNSFPCIIYFGNKCYWLIYKGLSFASIFCTVLLLM